MVTVMRLRGPLDEAGFSLVELLIAAAISAVVLGAAATLTIQVQRSYSTQLEDALVEEEARFALDWIVRTLQPAGANPYGITISPCPAAGTTFAALRLDPNGDGINNDVRVQADVNPPDGRLAGVAGACTQPGEDILISHDAANRVIARQDMAVDAAAVAMTEPVITQLTFTFLDVNRAVTAAANNVVYVRVAVTGQSRVRNPYTGQFTSATRQSEVRLRAR